MAGRQPICTSLRMTRGHRLRAKPVIGHMHRSWCRLLMATASIARCDSEPLPIEREVILARIRLQLGDQFGDGVDAETPG